MAELFPSPEQERHFAQDVPELATINGRNATSEVIISTIETLTSAHHIPLPGGLSDWAKGQGPDMWHEMARRADFAGPKATIDLLLAAHWICLRPKCDRATALLFLAQAAKAGLHGPTCPPQLAPAAAERFCRGLYAALLAGCFLREAFALSRAEQGLIDAQLGLGTSLSLPDELRRTSGRRANHAPYSFAGQRPVAMSARELVAA